MIERLDRIDALNRATASPAELLAELRGLLHDAEAWVRVEGGDEADEAVIRLAGGARPGCRARLTRDARCAVPGAHPARVPAGSSQSSRVGS